MAGPVEQADNAAGIGVGPSSLDRLVGCGIVVEGANFTVVGDPQLRRSVFQLFHRRGSFPCCHDAPVQILAFSNPVVAAHQQAGAAIHIWDGKIDPFVPFCSGSHAAQDEIKLAIVKALDDCPPAGVDRASLDPHALRHFIGDVDIVADDLVVFVPELERTILCFQPVGEVPLLIDLHERRVGLCRVRRQCSLWGLHRCTTSQYSKQGQENTKLR